MERYLEDLIARVPVKAAEFAQRLQAAVPSIIYDVGASSNSAFLFRSFVSVRSDNNGDELAVTVDITRPKNGTISIESDICMDDGSVIAAGPAAQFPLLDVNCVSSAAASAWSHAFDNFLEAHEPAVVHVISEMIEGQKNSVRKPKIF